MVYDLNNPLHREQFKLRCNALYKKGAIAVLSEKQFKTLSQNSYLHVILTHFANVDGLTMEYVKEQYLKRTVCPDIFIVPRYDKRLGREVETLRSTSELTKEEMSAVIDRFLNWSALEAGIYLPSPDDREMLKYVQVENERHNRWT